MIAVGVPAFDRFYRHENSTNRRARLLGVAGTDVPVEDIDKLTLPYKVRFSSNSSIKSNVLNFIAGRKWLLFRGVQQWLCSSASWSAAPWCMYSSIYQFKSLSNRFLSLNYPGKWNNKSEL